MKTFKTFLLTLILSVGFIVPSCNNGLDCNCGPVLEHFDIEGIQAQHSDMYWNILSASDSISYTSYRLWLQFESKYIAQETPAWDFGLSTIPTASACSCVPSGWEGSYEKIQQLSITTLNDFDANHLAGESINDLLLLDGKEIETYIADQTDFIQDQAGFFLELEKAAELNEVFLVRIDLTLDNGEEYSATSSVIRLF